MTQKQHHKECAQPQANHYPCFNINEHAFPGWPIDVAPDNPVQNVITVTKSGSEGKNSYRIAIPVRFDLIPPVVLRELAEIYEEGATKYGDAKYLESPLPNSVIMNHLMNHINLWWSGDRSEKHLAKAMWGLATIITLDHVNPGRPNDLFAGGKTPYVFGQDNNERSKT